MGKYLLLIAGVLVVYWILRSRLRRRNDATRQDKTIADDMVRCVECGVYVPRGESLIVSGQYYCCAAHQRRHDSES